MNKSHKFTLALVLILNACLALSATYEQPPRPEQAMALTHQVNGNDVALTFTMMPDIYMYRHAFKFTGKDLSVDESGVVIPKGKAKSDPNFGDVEVYYDQVNISVPVTATGPEPVLTIKYQGCIENYICYPPQKIELALASLTTPVTQAFTTQPVIPGIAPASGTSFFSGADQLLPVDQAFQFDAIALDEDRLLARFTMAPNIYLYKDQVVFTALTEGMSLGQPVFPEAQLKDDPEFGLVDVFYDVVEIEVPLNRAAGSGDVLSIETAFQGCEDGKVCYPPTSQLVQVDLPALTQPVEVTAVETATGPLSEHDQIAQGIGSDSLWWSLLKFYGWGLLLALTPCVFPMIPILSGLIVGQDNPSTAKAFTLSLIYVLAMALTYTLVGVLAGLSQGTNVQALFQAPWIIITFSAVFVLLALSMFGFYDLQLPASWQNKLSSISNKQKAGSWMGVAIMGLLSALIVGPCVAPPLAAAVIYISSEQGGPVVGGLTLFAMAMGMGTPLIAIGTSAGRWAPQSGGWMNVVKSFFGVMLLGMAIWFLSRILAPDTVLMLWGVLLVATAVMWHKDAVNNGLSGWVLSAFDALKVILLVVGVAQLIGGMAGQGDPLRPLKGVFSGSGQQVVSLKFKKIKTLEELQTELAGSDKPVYFDFYADWCTECIRMERTTFRDPEVVAMAENFTLIKADVTADDEQDQILRKHFGVVGPPASLFFKPGGEPLVAHNFFGYKSAAELKQTFEKILN